MPDLGLIIGTFTAGLLAFLSPCTAPLLPAYLSVISGVGAVELAQDETRHKFRGRLLLGSVLYVMGFATVLVLLGFSAAGLAHSIVTNRRPIEIVGGLLVTLFGLFILGIVRVPFLNTDRQFGMPQSWRRLGVLVAYPIGIIFAIGWTPCTGPYLGAAIVFAAASGTALKGGILLFVYALGLGLPFIGVALAWASLPRLPQKLSRLSGPLTKVGGIITVALGLALATGAYSHVTSFFAQFSTGN